MVRDRDEGSEHARHEHARGGAVSYEASILGLDSLPTSLGAAEPERLAHPFETHEDTRYRDPQVMAHGGMGRVSLVVDGRLGRAVALKEILPGELHAGGLERRLTQEAFITARLEHPGIVPIYDAGKGIDGRPFFTMRFIRGRSLADALRDGDLDQATLLRHFLAVCQAMAYAHALGVVHRDLKPSNVMLGEFGETQIVDWGLARELGQAESDDGLPSDSRDLVPASHAAKTSVGTRVGTPAYMSPEQAHARPLSRASDVWSLGAMLFEIAARRPLHDGLELAALYLRLERGAMPRLADVAPATSPELAAVVDRSLRREPRERYPDASGLATDIAAFIDGRRVGAYDYSAWDVTRRFARTFRTPLVIAALALVTIAVVFAVSYAQTLGERDRAQAAQSAADRARADAEQSQRRAVHALSEAAQSFATLLVRSAREALVNGAEAEAELLAAHALLRVESPEARGVLARYGVAARVAVQQIVVLPPCDRCYLGMSGDLLVCVDGADTSLWSRPAEPAKTGELELRWRIPRRLDAVAFVSAERALVSGDGLGATALLDLASGITIPLSTTFAVERARASNGVVLGDSGARMIRWDEASGVTSLGDDMLVTLRAISGDGRVAVTYDPTSGRPSLLDLARDTSSLLRPLPFDVGGAMCAALDTRGERAAFGSTEGELVTLDLKTSETRSWRLTTRSLTEVTWSPDDRWLAIRDERGWVTVIDPDSGAELPLPRVKASALAWRAEPGRVELVVLGDELRSYTLPARSSPTRYRATTGISALAMNQAGTVVALPDGSGAVRAYDITSGRLVGALAGRDNVVAKDAAFVHDGDGDLLVIWPARFEIGSWRPGRDPHARLLPQQLNNRRVVTTADGGYVTINYGTGVEIFDRADHNRSLQVADGGQAIDAHASADGRVVAWLSSRGNVEIMHVDPAHEPVSRSLYYLPEATRVALDETGARVAVASATTIHVVGTDDGRAQRVVSVPGARILEVALARDGTWLAAGSVDGEVWVWDARDVLRMSGGAHLERVSGLEFDPRGQWLLSASWDGAVVRWGLAGLAEDPAVLVARLERTWGAGLDHAIEADRR